MEILQFISLVTGTVFHFFAIAFVVFIVKETIEEKKE